MPARAFRDADVLAGRFERGDLVRVRGRVERFRDELQVDVRADRARARTPTRRRFLPVAYRDLDELDGFLEHLAREVHDPGYAALLAVAARRRRAARRLAARALHARRPSRLPRRPARAHRRGRDAGARGGAAAPAARTATCCSTAALVHDLGKTREFTYGAEIGLTDEGRLLGHLVLGQRMLDDRAGGRSRTRAGSRWRTACSPTTVPTRRPGGASAHRRRSRCTASTRSTRASRARSSTVSASGRRATRRRAG